MKKVFCLGRAFTGRWLRVIDILAVIAIILLDVFIFAGFDKDFPLVLFITSTVLYMVYEALSDYYRFPGIASQKSRIMSIVRSSPKGMTTLHEALKADLFMMFMRGILEVGIIPAVALYRFGIPIYWAILTAVNALLISFLVLVLIRLITRGITTVQSIYIIIALLFIYAGQLLITVCMTVQMPLYLPGAGTEAAKQLLIIEPTALIVLGILVLIVSRAELRKCGKGFQMGYYDNCDE